MMRQTSPGSAALAVAMHPCRSLTQVLTSFSDPAVTAGSPNRPVSPLKLVFMNRSSGENGLADQGGDEHSGGLGIALRDNNYFVSDTNYGWGPADADLGGTIGDHTY